MINQESTKSKWAGIAALFLVIAACLIYGGHTVLNVTADRIIANQGERVALAWAEYAGSELNRIERIASGAPPTSAETGFLDRLRQFGDVFRFKLFDASGRIRLISDDLHKSIGEEGSLGDHNPKAGSVIKDGKPFTSLEDGTAKPDRPDVYVESYVPVVRNGKTVAIVEVYVDQTAQAAAIRQDFAAFGIEIFSLTILALLLPFALLIVMNRRQRIQNVELEQERDNAQAAQRAKSEFLANMSHEIRTPLNGVLGMAGLMAGTRLTEDQKEYTGSIVQSGEALLTILNDILDFSKIEAGKIDLEESEFETISLLDSAVSLLSAQAHGKGLDMPTFVAADVPRKLIGDDGRIRQILLNLIGNAIKFTASGGVSIDLSVQKGRSADGHILLRFEIADTGIGIPEEARENLFNEFYQADGSHKRQYEGTGLGLAICKRLGELMGGEIGVEPRQSGGSLFWFTVQVKPQEDNESWAHEIGSVLEGRRILVVDDNEVNRIIFERQLQALGANVATAMSADSAVTKLRDAANSRNFFDGAIIDHFMPGTDGIDLVRMIRETVDTQSMKLILSSSSGEFNSDQAVQKHGFDASLPKPLRPGSLLRSANRIFGATASSPDKDEAEKVQPAETAAGRILVAEDNHINQKVIQAMLTARGFSVVVAADGIEAIEAVRKLPFDLILMDIKMPEMDGLDATRKIREFADERGELPIIGVTANAMKGDREKVIQAGMNDYLTKPINETELFDRIAFWTGHGKDRNEAGAEPAEGPKQSVSSKTDAA